jgi:DNA modification methylase
MRATRTNTPWANRIVAHGEEAPDKLIAHERNWRTHTQAQRSALSGVLSEVGLVQSVVVNTTTGRLLDGHLRVELARAQGQPTIPVVYVELGEDEERLVLASLDPIAAMAGADQVKLAELLASIESRDEQVRGLLEAIARQEHLVLPATAGLVDPDALPEVPAEPVTRAGDLWLCGDHRLLCGDATDPEQVGRLMAGERAALMATDPPYLVDYDGGNHPQTWGSDGRPISPEQKTRHWDAYSDHDTSVAFYADFLRAALAEALGDVPVVYQWFAMTRADIVMAAWRAVGLLCHQVVIWHKSRSVLGRCDFMWDYEPCLYGWLAGRRPEAALRPPADARAVWEVSSAIEDGAAHEHPTMKPTELIRRPIVWHTRPGELLYEPFSGSGTAIVAAEQTGRRCYALELSPAFCDVAVERWQRFAGKQATLEGEGRSFSELAQERQAQPTSGEPKGGGR